MRLRARSSCQQGCDRDDAELYYAEHDCRRQAGLGYSAIAYVGGCGHSDVSLNRCVTHSRFGYEQIRLMSHDRASSVRRRRCWRR